MLSSTPNNIPGRDRGQRVAPAMEKGQAQRVDPEDDLVKGRQKKRPENVQSQNHRIDNLELCNTSQLAAHVG